MVHGMQKNGWVNQLVGNDAKGYPKARQSALELAIRSTRSASRSEGRKGKATAKTSAHRSRPRGFNPNEY